MAIPPPYFYGFIGTTPSLNRTKKCYTPSCFPFHHFKACMVFDLKKTVPLTLENLVYIINASTVKDSTLAGFAPKMIQARLNDYFN